MHIMLFKITVDMMRSPVQVDRHDSSFETNSTAYVQLSRRMQVLELTEWIMLN